MIAYIYLILDCI